MATRSSITVKLSSGQYKSIYSHWAGYPSHNGKILLNHYSTQDKIDALVEPGDISVLDERCDKPAGHTFNTPLKGYTVYYGRDRGEHDVQGTIRDTAAEALSESVTGPQEYNYLWTGEKWFVNQGESRAYKDLAEVVADEDQ